MKRYINIFIILFFLGFNLEANQINKTFDEVKKVAQETLDASSEKEVVNILTQNKITENDFDKLISSYGALFIAHQSTTKSNRISPLPKNNDMFGVIAYGAKNDFLETVNVIPSFCEIIDITTSKQTKVFIEGIKNNKNRESILYSFYECGLKSILNANGLDEFVDSAEYLITLDKDEQRITKLLSHLDNSLFSFMFESKYTKDYRVKKANVDEFEDKMEESSDAMVEIYDILEDKGFDLNKIKPEKNSVTVFRKLAITQNIFDYLSSDYQQRLYDLYDLGDSSIKKTRTIINGDMYYETSYLQKIHDLVKFTLYGKLVLFLFLCALGFYYYKGYKKAMLKNAFFDSKMNFTNQVRNFFIEYEDSYINKIPNSQIFKIEKELIDLLNKYDELLIELLKAGLYSSEAEKKIEDIKKEILPLEENIKALYEEKKKIESLYESKKEVLSKIDNEVSRLKQYQYKLYDSSIKNIYNNIISELNKIGDKALESDIENDLKSVALKIDALIENIVKNYEEAVDIENILTKTDPYEILGVSREDDISKIKKRWKTLSIRFHPDKFSMEDEEEKNRVEELAKIVNGAWDTIKKEKAA